MIVKNEPVDVIAVAMKDFKPLKLRFGKSVLQIHKAVKSGEENHSGNR